MVALAARRWIERLGLVALGLFVATIALEGALRLAASFVGPRGIPLLGGRERVVLCLGDSNTYGVYYAATEAYPGQLQDVLDGRAPGRYRVLNLGLPGMNSAEIAARLPEWLDRYHPAAVVVGAGINNLWNRTDADAPATRRAGWTSELRLVRLYRLAAAAFRVARLPAGTGRRDVVRVLRDAGARGQVLRDAATNDVVDVHDGNLAGFDLGTHGITDRLGHDLDAMLAATRARHVTLLLLTYAAFPLPNRPATIAFLHFEALNDEMRRFGREHDVRVIDLNDRFTALLGPTTPRVTYFASEQESHLNPRGYAEVATLVAGALE